MLKFINLLKETSSWSNRASQDFSFLSPHLFITICRQQWIKAHGVPRTTLIVLPHSSVHTVLAVPRSTEHQSCSTSRMWEGAYMVRSQYSRWVPSSVPVAYEQARDNGGCAYGYKHVLTVVWISKGRRRNISKWKTQVTLKNSKNSVQEIP